MHGHGPGFRGRRGWGRGRRFPNAERLLEWLEEYQRDLEQETADVADLIRRLRDNAPAQTQSV